MEFTEKQIQNQMTYDRDEHGFDDRELAILELEDIARKGCTHPGDVYCIECRDKGPGFKCPMSDWIKKHPEFVKDDLAKKIENRIQLLSGKAV